MYHSHGDIGNEEGYARVGTGDIWEISYLPLNFFCEAKLLLKIQFLKSELEKKII